MPKIRRRCALCDAPLPENHPTNTCQKCQADEEAGVRVRDYQALRSMEAAVIAHQAHGFASIVPVPDQIGTAVCDQCHRPIWNVTSICHPRNPIFDCPFGLRNESHRHHFCACGHEVITVTITLPQEAENHGTTAEHS